MIGTEIDEKRAKVFAEKMLGLLNGGALTLMISVGHRTSLFDVMAHMPPATSEEIAGRAALNERYVREWLGAMVTGGIVEYEPSEKRYRLPPEHAASLARAAAPANLAPFMQYISVLGSVEDRIIECFRNGGGVPYSEFLRFHEVMAEDSGQTVVAALFDSILPLVPGLLEALDKGIEVLDIGCGRGRALNLMASAFPRSRFTGYDFAEEAIQDGRAEAGRQKLENIRFEVKNVTSFGETERYDLITAFDAIHDQAKPDTVLKSVATALRPDGTFLMQDIAGSSHLHKNLDHPAAPFLYTVSCMHCMSVSLALNGAGLGTMWGEEKALEMLKAAGFVRVETRRLPHDFQNVFYIARKK